MKRQRNDTTRRRSKSAPTSAPRLVSEHASPSDILINQLNELVSLALKLYGISTSYL